MKWHVCIGDSTVKVIYYKHTILNVYHVYVGNSMKVSTQVWKF